MTSLQRPTPSRVDDWIDLVHDFAGGPMDGSSSWQVDDFGADRRSFDDLQAEIEREADPTSDLPEGHVHADHFWICDGDDLVGFLAVRHSIDTDFLRVQGGHVGYSVRPSRRREGHASRALALAVEHAGTLGIDRVLVTCDLDNRASAATIESCGGVLEDEREGKRRSWITPPRRRA